MPNLSKDFKLFTYLPDDGVFTRREVGEFFVSNGHLPASTLPAFFSRLKIRIVRHKVPTVGIKKGADGIPRNAYLGAALKLTFKGWREDEIAAMKSLVVPSPKSPPAMLFTSTGIVEHGGNRHRVQIGFAVLAAAALIALFLFEKVPPPGRQDLLQRWRETRDPDLVAQLADHPVQPATNLSLAPPIQALFLCEPYHAVLCGDALLMVGDWVTKDGWSGYISEVTVDGITAPFLSLKVRNGATTEVIRWPLSDFKGPDHVYIYSSGNNLGSILRALQRLGDITIEGALDGGLVHGTYAVDSYAAFIDTIADACYLTFDGTHIFVNPTQGVRSHIRPNRFLRHLTLQEILTWYGDLLGMPLIFDDLDDILSSQVTFGLYNCQFDDLLMHFRLDHEINGGVVRISRSLPR